MKTFRKFSLFIRIAILALATFPARADDWPQWMGPQRDGVWRETGIVEKLPAIGPPVLWRTNVNRGYCGPAVVGDRLFMLDRLQGQPPERKPGERALPVIPGNERVLCLDALTGAKIWEHTYDCAYRISYPSGPRATPLVAGGRVFTLGAMGDLLCLDARDGKVIWERHFLKDFTDEPPVWGYAAHPLLDGDDAAQERAEDVAGGAVTWTRGAVSELTKLVIAALETAAAVKRATVTIEAAFIACHKNIGTQSAFCSTCE